MNLYNGSGEHPAAIVVVWSSRKSSRKSGDIPPSPLPSSLLPKETLVFADF